VNNEAGDRYTLSATLGAGTGSGSTTAAPSVAGTLATGTSISDFRTTRVTFGVADDMAASVVRVTLDLSHARTSDLSIRLTAPDGRRVVLFNRVGGATLGGATFETAAFAGALPKGEWVLEIFDVVSGQGGTLRSAALSFGG
jgi:subtilisin-like proprotein convertase family protein